MKTQAEKVWRNMEQIKDPIRSINNNSDDYNEQYMKIIFYSDDEDVLWKNIKIVVSVRSFFQWGQQILFTNKFS